MISASLPSRDFRIVNGIATGSPQLQTCNGAFGPILQHHLGAFALHREPEIEAEPKSEILTSLRALVAHSDLDSPEQLLRAFYREPFGHSASTIDTVC